MHITVNLVPPAELPVACDAAAVSVDGDEVQIYCPESVTREVREACAGLIATYLRRRAVGVA